MRDLLYLSENKMRALVPQLPGKLRKRLGFEAGLNVGVVSAKATLPGESSQPSSVAALDAVVEMIEREKGSRWRTDPDLRAGEWIQFDEEFRYGDAATAEQRVDLDFYGPDAHHALSGLVYFAMQAINAGTMSATAWPLVREGLDAAVAVSDAQAMAAHKLLNESEVTAGPAGAAALAGAMHTLSGGEGESVRATLGLSGTSDVVVVSADGALASSGGGSA